MRTRSLTLIPVAVLAATLLSGCVFNVGLNTSPTVDPQEVADQAADALEGETGVRPDIDCGDDPIPVEANTSVTCLLVDPVVGLEFDVVIGFDEVSQTGGDVAYTISVTVADVPNNAPQPTAAPGTTVPVADIQALAIRALTPTLDFVPEVICDATEVEIVVGNTVDCSYESPDGTVEVLVTITAFDQSAGEYTIRVTDR